MSLIRKFVQLAMAGELRADQVRGTEEEVLQRAHEIVDRNGHRVASDQEIFAEKVRLFPVEQLAQTHPPRSFDQHAVVVTALSLLPHHRQKQAAVLDSWVRFGFTVHAVNTAEEIRKLRAIYPQVHDWIACEETTTDYPTATQRIVMLARVAILLDRTVLLINSDIEVHGPRQRLIDALAKPKTQVVGIRWNYWQGQHKSAKREQWGLDVFSFTPEMAATLPLDAPLGIGRPMWDYWIPCHFRSLGYAFDFIGEPFFFHPAHPVHWSQRDWDFGAKWVMDRYGFSRFNMADSVAFRGSFPFPPEE